MTQNVASTIGDRVRRTRERLGLTQEQVAELMGWKSGRTAVSRLESGAHMPRSDTLAALCSELKVSADYLLGLSRSSKRRP